MESAVTDLPEPLSPHPAPSSFAPLDVEGDAGDGAHALAGAGEVDREVADADPARSSAHQLAGVEGVAHGFSDEDEQGSA